MTVGDKLQELMDWQGHSQQDIAALSGISRTMVSQYIRGVSEPTLEALRKLAEALNVTPWMLINGDPLAVKDFDLIDSERQLIGMYRTLSVKAQAYIDSSVRALVDIERGN